MGVKIKIYDIIYDLLESLQKQILKIIEPTIDEQILGTAEVIAIFDMKGERIAGCKIKSGEISKNKTEQFISEGALQKSSAKKTKMGDLLYALYGATSGAVAISKIDGAINQAVLCIRTNEDKNWLLNYLSYSKGKILAKYLQGGQGNLSADIVKNLKIVFPSLSEQQKIAEFLGVVDGWIENLKKQKENFESYKKGMMQKIFSQEVRFKDDNGKDFPKWEQKKLGEVCNISTAPYIETKRNQQNGYYLIDMGAVSADGKLLVKKRTSGTKNILNVGDLVMPNRDIGHGDIIGKVALIDLDNKYVLGNNMYKINPKDGSLSTFMFFLINSEGVNREMRRRSNGTSQLQLIRKDVEFVKFSLPSPKEQHKIAEFLTSIDKIIESKQQQITQAEQWKRGLMQGLFV